MKNLDKHHLGGIAFLAVGALLLIETCLTMIARSGSIDFLAVMLAVAFVIAPVALAAMFAFLASSRLVIISSLTFTVAAFLIAIWLLHASFSARSSTAVIALVFWPIVEVMVIITCLGLFPLVASVSKKISSGSVG